MKGLSALAAIAAIGAGLAASNQSQYIPRLQPSKVPPIKLGKNLTKDRAKAKARRKAQQKARRTT